MKIVKTMMLVVVLSGLVYGEPLFSDGFDTPGWSGWNVGFAGTGWVANYGGYAYLHEDYPAYGYANLRTQNTFSIGQGLEIDVIMMFPMNAPGTAGFANRPNMTLQDAAGNAFVGIYSPFSFGATGAPIVMQARSSGVMADAHTTPSVGTSGWYRFIMNVYADHVDVRVYENGTTFRDQWTATYDAIDAVRVAFSADCPGWWPPAELLVDQVNINPITSPQGTVEFQNGSNGYYEQSDATLDAGLWGISSGYSSPGSVDYGTGSMFFQQSDGTYWARNLLKFDLEGLLPEGAVVTQATLTLTLRTAPDPTPENPVGLAAYKANQPWDPNNTYWLNWGYGGNSVGYCNLTNPDGVTYFGPAASPNSQISMTLTTSMVQNWINQPWTNYGVLLGQLDWQWYNFYVYGTEVIGTDLIQYGPKLNIDYYYPAGAKSLTRGHRTLLKKGLQILGSYAVNDFSMARFHDSMCSTLDTTDDYLHWDWIKDDPNVLWARMTWNPILPGELPFLRNCVSFKEGDEQDIIAQSNLDYMKSRMDTFKAGCPNAILFTNQYGGQFTYEQLHNYVLYTQPDMVMFDKYPFAPNQVGLPATYYDYMATYRRLGLEGLDGTGTKPIPSALYTQTFVSSDPRWQSHRVTESEMRINQFSAWTFGFKYVNLFVYMTPLRDTSFQSLLFNGLGDTSPTPEFYQLAETNRQSRNLGSALIRLISTDLRMIMGQNAGGIVNPAPAGVTAGIAGADPYMTGIIATNSGTKNSGHPGDVMVGFFKLLHESFDGDNYTNEKYFMITNGLCDGTGSAADTRQTIRINFDFGTSGITSLHRLSRLTGQGEVVRLVHDGGSLYHLDLVLDGGTGDLFKYNTGAPFVGFGTIVATKIPGDANHDGKVDVSDLGILAANYGMTGGATWETGDFNGDFKVDVSDLGILAANYGTGTGGTLDFNADAKALGLVTDSEIQKEETPAISTLGCGSAGLPLIAGIFLAGLTLATLKIKE